MRPEDNQLAKLVAQWLALPMFVLSLIFLALVAALIVVWVDIPRVNLTAELASESEAVTQDTDAGTNAEIASPPQSPISTSNPADQQVPTEQQSPTADSDPADPQSPAEQASLEETAAQLGDVFLTALYVIWPVFWLEFLVNLVTHDRRHPKYRSNRVGDLMICVCPPLRLATSNGAMDGQIWLPRMDWQAPGKPLSQTLERTFGKPMLTIALLILPILLIEFGLQSLVESNFWLRLTLHICTGLIWCAFAIEFIIMVSATDKKFAYVKKNWIDLAIILLPLISFLRSLRVIRAAKMARFAKLQQLTKMSRIYRMRGLLAKALRALLLFEIVHRLLRNTPEKQLKRLKTQFTERSEELEELKREIERLESTIDRQDPPKDPNDDRCNNNSNKSIAPANSSTATDSNERTSDVRQSGQNDEPKAA